jgi:hypothetical protein
MLVVVGQGFGLMYAYLSEIVQGHTQAEIAACRLLCEYQYVLELHGQMPCRLTSLIHFCMGERHHVYAGWLFEFE